MRDKISHDYMERCPYCKKYLLASQIRSHICDASLLGVKEIPVVFFCETTDQKGNKLVLARGYDGFLYRLVKCLNPLSSDDGYHEPSNRRQVNKTQIRVLSSLR
jgi:hypothetical protein